MSQHENDLYVEELRDENEELLLQIEELKLRLSQYENVESSTRSDERRSEWSEWPYCWLIEGWNRAGERFQQFHAIVQDTRLARRNLSVARRFQNRNGCNETEMTLM